MDRLLTIEEVAEVLRTPVDTLRHWRAKGKGPQGARLGMRVMYRESDVRKWLEAQFKADARRRGVQS